LQPEPSQNVKQLAANTLDQNQYQQAYVELHVHPHPQMQHPQPQGYKRIFTAVKRKKTQSN
jgi:hypothetical protein